MNLISGEIATTSQTLLDQLRPTIRAAIERLVKEELQRALAATTTAITTVAAAEEPSAAVAPAKRGRKPGRKPGRPAKGTVCTTAGCNKPARSKGLCAAHYQAARRYAQTPKVTAKAKK